ncbi:GDI interacting protein 3 isoform X2 [Lycorma delicatula]
MAGPGHKLSETKPTSGRQKNPTSVNEEQTHKPRAAPSNEAKHAAAAALARLGGGKHDAPAFNTSMAAIQAKVRREIEAEKAAAAAAAAATGRNVSHDLKGTTDSDEQLPLALAVQGVYFRCPLISDEILSKDEWKLKIKEFLYEQLCEEQGLTACLIIHSCNKSREKVEQCVETLSRYLENIIQNPDEEKYRKIRMSNKVFTEKVSGMEGAMEFLNAAGFKYEMLPFQDTQEQFLVFYESELHSIDNLTMLLDALRSAEPIGLQLDRNLQVLLPSQAAKQTNLPQDFFKLTPEELKREQQLKSEKVDNSLVLKTKAMREREEQRELKKYRFALIRIRFPDDILIQGTFGIYEHVSDVYDFVRENLLDEESQFVLLTATGHRLTESDYGLTLIDLRLIPASVLTFVWISDHPISNSTLKPEVMLLQRL